jgi:hypothetical protein
MSDTISADAIRAQMPHATLTRVTGEPTHKLLKLLEKELAANLMAIPCPWGHGKGHLGLLQDPVLYLQRNGAAFDISDAAPPDYPINAPAALPVREAARAANLVERKAWNTYLVVAAITRDQFAAAIDDVYYAALDDPTEGLNAVTLRDLVAHIRTTYATISQPDIDDNMVDFHTGIDAQLPLAVYTRKQEKCQTFALDAGIPISEATMVSTGTKAALNCGGMELAWREWTRRPIVDHTWNNWKTHWTAAFAESRDITRMTAGDRAFANQAATDAEQAERMAASLDNLANAAIQKNDTVDKLVAANERLAKALADANSALARLRLPQSAGATGAASPPPAASGGSDRPRPDHWSKDKPAWDPTGYCWTHGFKVKVGHSSATCARRLEGHIATATRTNTKGGCHAHRDWTGT